MVYDIVSKMCWHSARTRCLPPAHGLLIFPPRVLLFSHECDEELTSELDGEPRYERCLGKDDGQKYLPSSGFWVVHLAGHEGCRISKIAKVENSFSMPKPIRS